MIDGQQSLGDLLYHLSPLKLGHAFRGIAGDGIVEICADDPREMLIGIAGCKVPGEPTLMRGGPERLTALERRMLSKYVKAFRRGRRVSGWLPETTTSFLSVC